MGKGACKATLGIQPRWEGQAGVKRCEPRRKNFCEKRQEGRKKKTRATGGERGIGGGRDVAPPGIHEGEDFLHSST